MPVDQRIRQLTVHAGSGELSIVRRLLKSTPKLAHDWRPIHEAARHGHPKIVAALIRSGADVDARGGAERFRPLHRAIKRPASIKKTRMNERDVISKFGVRPAHIPEYLAMVGDPSDGLPGIPGFGPKATTALISRYGHLEDILKSAGSWDVEVRGKEKLADTLIDRGNEALLYRNLSMLRTDVPLPERLEDLVWQGADRKKVEAVVETMEDPSLHERTVRYR